MINDMKEALAKQEAQKTAPYVRDGVKGNVLKLLKPLFFFRN